MRVKINGRFFDFFTDIKVDSSLDSMASSFSLKGRFNPSIPEHRDIFTPLSFNRIEIFNSRNNLILIGFIVNTALNSSSVRNLQTLSGYSTPGILEDCTIPQSSYPLEKLNLNLRDIASNLLSDFNIDFVVDPSVSNDMDINYAKTVATPEESIKSFLSKLASQRNIILGHNNRGEVRFFRPNTSSPSKLFLNETNTLEMSLKANGQGVHSEITVIRQPDKNNVRLTPVDTVQNRLVGTRRSVVKVMTAGTETDTLGAAQNLLASQLKNIQVQAKIEGVVDDLNVGDVVEVLNEEIHIYNRSRLVVSSMSMSETNKSEQTVLNLVLPETFTGENPVNIFL